MALPVFTAGATLPATDLADIVNHLQGASGKTDAWHFRVSSGNNYLITLSDAAGAQKFSIRDSAGAEQFSVDSDGTVTVTTLTPTTLNLPTASSPSQTTDGRVVWDSDDDRLTVGTGAATKVIGLSRGAGSDASATQELMYDTTNAQLKAWNGSASKVVGGRVDDIVRQSFRDNRRLVAEYAAQNNTASGTSSAVGVGFYQHVVAATDIVGTLTGEPYMQLGTDASGTTGILSAASGSTNGVAVIAPNTSPRYLARLKLPAASANVTSFLAGFFASAGGVTANGAYLRIATTGNTFFVTRQGGTETTTDLGALSRTTILGFEIETADAGVTWVCRNQAGTVLATHTTNVPTAATALVYGVHYVWATATIPIGIAYQRVDGTFA